MGDTTTQSNGFITVADNSIHVMHVTHAVDHDSDRTNLQIDLLQSIECHTKVVNMCCMVDYDRVVTCSREPIIKMWNLGKGDGDNSGDPIAKFEGHEMSVSTVAYESSFNRLASAGRDCTTRVWDVETQKSIQKRKISRNVVT